MAWTYDYLFSDGNASTFDCVTHEFVLGDHRRLSACLSFVTTAVSRFETGHEPLVVAKRSKKKNRKKKEVDEDLIFLNREMSKVELEKKNMDAKRAISRVKKLEKFSGLVKKVEKTLPILIEKIKSRMKKEALCEMKMHKKSIDMTRLILVDRLAHWIKDARSYMGTKKNSKCALECFMESPNNWLLNVRTFSQLKFMRMYFAIAFKDMKVHFSRDPYNCIWDVTEYVKNFPFVWKVSLQVRSNLTIFDDPSVVPFQIGRIILPKKAKYEDHFQFKENFLCMPVERGTIACREMATSLIDREFTESESEKFNACIFKFTNEFSLNKDGVPFFNVIWTCSEDGIFLMAGCYDEVRSHFNRFFTRFAGAKRLILAIFSFLRLPDQAFSPETIRICPFFSAVGFACIPDYLPDSRIPARMITHFSGANEC